MGMQIRIPGTGDMFVDAGGVPLLVWTVVSTIDDHDRMPDRGHRY